MSFNLLFLIFKTLLFEFFFTFSMVNPKETLNNNSINRTITVALKMALNYKTETVYLEPLTEIILTKQTLILNSTVNSDFQNLHPNNKEYNTTSKHFYPHYIHSLAEKLNISDLKELNHSYNYFEHFGYMNVIERLNKEKLNEIKNDFGEFPLLNRPKKHLIPKESDELVEQYIESLKLYQKFVGINITGKLDKLTKMALRKPRCGNRDFGEEKHHQQKSYARSSFDNRFKRYALSGSRWKPKNQVLNYCVSKFPFLAIKLNATRLVLREIKKAFRKWTSYLPFNTENVDCSLNNITYDIDIRFESNEHGDDDPFDGPGLILAHALFPEFGGSIHLDEAEYWTSTSKGSNLYSVTLHEIGHSLGLDHSDNIDSVMAPVYKPFHNDIDFHQDDLNAIDEIYKE